jgi:hypothetical protein
MNTRLSRRERVAKIREMRIEQARQILKPPPIKLGVVPDWFSDRLVKVFGQAQVEPTESIPVLLARAFGPMNLLVENWGSSIVYGREAFVLEVDDIFFNCIDYLIVMQSALDRLDCTCWFSVNSYLRPGKMVRIILAEPDADVIKVPFSLRLAMKVA